MVVIKSLDIKINGITNVEGMRFHDIEGGFGAEKKSMLVKDIAEIHGKDLRAVNQAINMNRKRFQDGTHIIDLKSINQIDRDFLNTLGFSNSSIANANNIYILSERGYATLLKILEDDFAWEQYDKLVNCYFNLRKEIKSKQLPREELLALAVLEAQKVIGEKDKVIHAQEKEIGYKKDIILGLTDDIGLVDKRNLLSRLVRKRGSNFQSRWNLLYREFDNKFHINSKKRFERYNKTAKPKLSGRLDYIDKVMGKIPDLYEVACRLFEGDVEKIVKEYYDINNSDKQFAVMPGGVM